MTQQYIKPNTGAKEIQEVNPGGPDNSQSTRPLSSHQYEGCPSKSCVFLLNETGRIQ